MRRDRAPSKTNEEIRKSFFRHCRDIAAQNKKATKPKLSVVAIKKAKAVMEASGKNISGLTVSPDGSFRLTLAAPDANTFANPWDEVLK